MRRGNGDPATRRHHREIQLWRARGPVLSQREMFDINEIDSIKASLLVLNDWAGEEINRFNPY